MPAADLDETATRLEYFAERLDRVKKSNFPNSVKETAIRQLAATAQEWGEHAIERKLLALLNQNHKKGEADGRS